MGFDSCLGGGGLAGFCRASLTPWKGVWVLRVRTLGWETVSWAGLTQSSVMVLFWGFLEGSAW